MSNLAVGTRIAPSDVVHGTRLNNLKILSSNIDDLTTPENILKSFVKPGMSDAERSTLAYERRSSVRFSKLNPPPGRLSGDTL